MNRVVLVRVDNRSLAEKLREAASNTSAIVQQGEGFGFAAFFDLPRPTKGDSLNLFLQVLDSSEATYKSVKSADAESLVSFVRGTEK